MTRPAAYLGQHLRRLRLMAGFTIQAALAVRLSVSNDYVSNDYVSKAENRLLPPAEEVFLAWLDVCGASAEARDFLTGLWTVVRALSGGIPQFFAKYVTAEEKAAFLRLWGLLLIPGPLQTRDYAHAMFLAGGLDEDAAAEQVGLRMKRQAILDGPDPAHVTALIYEPVLSCRVGTPEVMIGQLGHPLEMSRRRNVIIQVVLDTGLSIEPRLAQVQLQRQRRRVLCRGRPHTRRGPDPGHEEQRPRPGSACTPRRLAGLPHHAPRQRDTQLEAEDRSCGRLARVNSARPAGTDERPSAPRAHRAPVGAGIPCPGPR
ncbi:MAG: binding protein with helix-turn-helix domain [Actinomycetia bacterium]|nr:binding protein with helix-turn-helix domain [Actinomycetes bacterium]